jgi:hypothetical protein
VAKLTISIQGIFEFTPFIAKDAERGMVPLKPQQIDKLIANAVNTDYSLSAIMFNRKDEYEAVMFEFPAATLKKGGVFSMKIDSENGRVNLEVKGELSTKPLRAGVSQRIESYGEGADLRLESFFYKGGEWSGFKAPLLDLNSEDSKSWPKLADWTIK